MRLTLRPLLMSLALALSAVVATAGGGAAQDSPFDAALPGLLAKSFKDKAATAEALAATGDARALPLLQALLAGELHYRKADKAILTARRDGSVVALFDPYSGEPLGEAGRRDVKKITINNSLRGLLRQLIGGLTLLAPDRDQRLAAATAVFAASDAGMLDLVAQARAAESDPTVRAALDRTYGALLLDAGDTLEARLEGVALLAGHPDPEVKSKLQAALHALEDADAQAAPLRAAMSGAVADIETRLDRLALAQSLFQGISLGSVLLLAAIGLAITFGVMGVINMAHGEMVMIGAYTTFVVQQLCHAVAPGSLGLSLALSIPAAFLVAGAVGIAIERSIIRFLYGRPLETLLATWGLSLVLQQAVRSIFGPTNREVGTPDWMSGAVEVTGGLLLTSNRIAIICFALAVFVGLIVLMRYSHFGLQMRAVTQNRRMAGSMGIHTGRIDALTFGLGSGIAGVAGVALSQIDNVSPNLGQSYIIDSFMVVVFGGVGNLWGTLLGALSLGVINKFLEPVAGAVLGKILVLVALILFIQKRPRGLFALKGRAVES